MTLKLILPEDVEETVGMLKKEGDNLQMRHKNLKAVEKYEEAYRLIPEPKNAWAISLILLGSMAENFFLNRNFSEAIKIYEKVMSFPQAIGISNYHLRIGQIRYEFGEFEKAKDEFMRVYMNSGENGFEHENPKYYELIRPIVEAKR